MVNAELVRAFERIADLLEIDGADGFRINSYRRAARTWLESRRFRPSSFLRPQPGSARDGRWRSWLELPEAVRTRIVGLVEGARVSAG